MELIARTIHVRRRKRKDFCADFLRKCGIGYGYPDTEVPTPIRGRETRLLQLKSYNLLTYNRLQKNTLVMIGQLARFDSYPQPVFRSR